MPLKKICAEGYIVSNLSVLEYQSNRVLTTQQLADVYETETNNIVKNFSRNEDRFIEGRDYHLLQGDKLKLFKSNMTNSHFAPNLNKLYLWTERGANRHCKILDTNKAWEQFDMLEETYFRAKEMFSLPKTLPEALRMAAELAEKIEKQKTLVAFAQTCARSEESILVRELAKIASKDGIVVGERRLWTLLREWKLIFSKSTEPYQECVDKGLFEVSQSTKETSKGVKLFKTTRVTPKGQMFIIQKLKGIMS